MQVRVIKGFKDKESAQKEKDMTVYRRNDKFVSKDFERIKDLQDKGYLEKVEIPEKKPENVETADANPVIQKAPAVEDMTFDELKSFVKENNIEVAGTGKNGAVTKKDIENELEKMTEKGD